MSVVKDPTGIPLNYFAPADATALASEIKSGQTAYIGGGKVTGAGYFPAMMQYDGSATYYNKSFTSSGDDVTAFARFSRAAFAGDTYEIILKATGPTGDSRIQISVMSNDQSGIPARSNDVGIYIQNSAGATIFNGYTDVGALCDGNVHSLFVSFDGSEGDLLVVVDGQVASVVEQTAATAGTLDSGASTVFIVGALSGPTQEFGGELGFIGYADLYRTNYTDFFDSNGNPKQLDESGWTQFGGTQPEFFNPHGEMTNNRGSAGNMTANGTIIVGDGGSA